MSEKTAHTIIVNTASSVESEIALTKAARKELDTVLQSHLKQVPMSREQALAVTKLQEAIMWLGMNLKRIADKNPEVKAASPNPYPTSYDPKSKTIEPTADGLKR
jgi:hypothetical protein